MQIERYLASKIQASLFSGKIIVVYGARQVGKTTLVKQIAKPYASEALYLNADEPDVRAQFTHKTSTELANVIGSHRLLILDEAQRIPDIGLTLKLMVDNLPGKQIIATGSSAFELANQVVEPLTGRKRVFRLHPFSWQEANQGLTPLEARRQLETRIITGMYPEIVTFPGDAKKALAEIGQSYLYKDLLNYAGIRHPQLLETLLEALALQIGNEVSYNELASLLGTSKQTITNYIQLLEQSFVIFRLRPLSRNSRKELSKLRKIYFYDTGIRNLLIRNFNPLHLRQDVGALWENFMLSERMKWLQQADRSPNQYFWRTYSKQEIDLVEDENGALTGYEFKWREKQFKPPKAFLETYPGSLVEGIHQENFQPFLGVTGGRVSNPPLRFTPPPHSPVSPAHKSPS